MPTELHREIEGLLPQLMAFARSLTKNHHDAEDLLQSSIERALKNLAQYEPGTNLRAWMFTIMRNVYINDVRKRARRGTVTCAIESEHLYPVVAGQPIRLEARDFARAYTQLPESQKKVVDLVGVEGWSYQEAADQLGVPVGTVRSRLSRARNTLHQILDSDGVTTQAA